jgi:hypothetical protein
MNQRQADGLNHSRTAGRLLLFLAAGALCVGCLGGNDSLTPEDSEETASALVTTYKVGPTRTYKSLSEVASLLAPGDTVEVDGNATYAGGIRFTRSGTALQKITIRGLRVNGKRPVFSGSINTVEINANHYVFEGIDVTGGSSRCFYHHGDDITVRDTVVHDCPAHGILGSDAGSGSLTLDYVEVYRCGNGIYKHSIYMATDETAYPGSIFRMQHCYVHDALGGNSVKSRAQRNEIYYNWVEGGLYKELELIGPDGQNPALAREDSDVVGNVLRKTHTQYVVRIGGDGTGETDGRYRFVNNTFILAPDSMEAIQLFDGVESVELHNNVFFRTGGGSLKVLRDEASWTTGSALIAGSHNFVPTGSTSPSQWTGTLTGNNAGFIDLANRNVRLQSTSPLINAGATSLTGITGHLVPSPLAIPVSLPPPGVIEAPGSAKVRTLVGAIDIGAYEF